MLSRYLLFVVLLSLMQFGHAKFICANCYWDEACGSISVDDVVQLGLTNESPGIKTIDKGPFTRFYCDNGRDRLGVLWADQPCALIGGLTGLNERQFPQILDKSHCKFGH